MFAYAAFFMLAFIAVIHSVLGEAAILRPLFARSWDVDVPRFAVERVLRFAWHLTSIAWVGLAAAVVGVPAVDAMGVVCVASGLIILAVLRGHLAWPLFLLAGAFAWASADAIPFAVSAAVAGAAAALSAGLAGLHVYWAAGGRWGFQNAVPQRRDGKPAFVPGPLACLAVAGACATLAALLAASIAGASSWWGLAGLGVAAATLIVRAVGDGRQAGFTKQNRATAFARADDSVYTPLTVLLAFGALAGLYLGVGPSA